MSKHHLIVPTKTGRRLLSICLVGLATGCAPMQSHEKPASLKPIDELSSSRSFAEATADSAQTWPKTDWWKAYGDPQLDALIEEALRDSPDLAVAETRLRLAGAAAQIAGATRLPEVSVNAAVTEEKQSYNHLAPRAALPSGWNDYGRASLNLSWELDFWGKNRAALAAATSEQDAARAIVAQSRLVLSTSVAAAYADLVHLFTIRDSAEAALALRSKTVDLFRQRHGSGLENLASVRQVEARRATAEAQLLAVDERIALLRNAIAALLGAGPDRGLAIARPTASFVGSTGLPPSLALDLVGRRPDIVAARLRTEAAARRIDQSIAGFYPSVNLQAAIGFLSLGVDNLAKSDSRFGSVGPAISLPIFNRERLHGQLKGARAEYDEAVLIYNATLTHALREVADAVTSRKALDGELAATRAAFAAAGEAHQIVSRRYQGQLATYLDVLTAEDALISARRALADLETRALVLDVALVRALGGGFASAAAPNPDSTAATAG